MDSLVCARWHSMRSGRHEIRDQGVAGSNPVSPTQKAANLHGKPWIRGLRHLLSVTRLQSFRSGGLPWTALAALASISGTPANTVFPRTVFAKIAGSLG